MTDITSSSNGTYPTWQEAYRKAQAERDQKRADDEANKARQAAEAARERGANLGKALAFVGIQAQPETNEYILDGYHFRLTGTFQIFPAKNETPESLAFMLEIWKPQPRVYGGDPEQASYIVDVAAHYGNYRHEKTLTAIADAFDHIDKEIAWREEELKSRAERKAAQSEEDWQKPAQESDEEKLLKLLRSLVREEIRSEIYE